ncbi:heterogeneous nuclear ribonucleoprotein A2 homolog 2-like [Spodoptera litura]|uniref:Heterogeneous nuclear ribonucleoprotein A2 homolog 2-like n=1 Tax=Spodoptera litura TaxID=69820 RepID=A0A9J7E364_SPOLT|nr:heterogeneous nuclear ribonucleoprotein A2 homolog 2-like [Spodoptera litura]
MVRLTVLISFSFLVACVSANSLKLPDNEELYKDRDNAYETSLKLKRQTYNFGTGGPSYGSGHGGHGGHVGNNYYGNVSNNGSSSSVYNINGGAGNGGNSYGGGPAGGGGFKIAYYDDDNINKKRLGRQTYNFGTGGSSSGSGHGGSGGQVGDNYYGNAGKTTNSNNQNGYGISLLGGVAKGVSNDAYYSQPPAYPYPSQPPAYPYPDLNAYGYLNPLFLQ